MAKSEMRRDFFSKGVDNQKIADLTFSIKRKDLKDINKMSTESIKELKEFLLECKKDIDDLISWIE